MTEPHDSLILHFIVRAFMVPFIIVFGIYVLVHGEASPGGGFQAGAIVAAAFVLARLTLGREHAVNRFPTRVLIWTASLGMAVYLLAGVVPLFFGANFLDYSQLPVGWFNNIATHDETLRARGIFIVEFGVFLAVLGTLGILYDYLTERYLDD
ncbi:MAG: cation:proton antiporter [Chloroflexota bacterium]|nr:cation:proton antiporter [Chloroflexota bacterium]MDE2970471.1 cation:proton antiporter [Chloroflexota bacterium]